MKLGNIVEDDEITGTDTLYVRPGDTVVITWFITIVAMSDISVVDSSEELLEPEIGQVNMEILDSED